MSAGQDQDSPVTGAADEVIAPLPRVTIQAFCETPGVAATMQAAIADRRMEKAHARISHCFIVRRHFIPKRAKREPKESMWL